jgi:hypothetical protein
MKKYNLKSIDVTANINIEGNLKLDTFTYVQNNDENDIFVAHKPTPEEYEYLFRKECR